MRMTSMITSAGRMVLAVAALSVTAPAAAGAAGDPPPTFAWAFGAGIASSCQAACQAGTPGAGAEQFDGPADVAALADGGMLVADRQNNRIVVLGSDQSFVRTFASSGGGAGRLQLPSALTRAGGEVFVADQANHRISVFNVDGTFARAFGKGVDPSADGTPDLCTTTCQAGTGGTGPGQLSAPVGVAVAGSEVFVSDAGAQRISVFSLAGDFERTIGAPGSDPGELVSPAGLAVDGSELYVADRSAQRISVFSLGGTFLRAFGAAGAGTGQLAGPAAVAVTGGHVFVAEADNDRVSVFEPSGTYVTTFATTGSGAGQLSSPNGITVDAGGLAVADLGNNRVSRFTTGGAFVDTVGHDVDTALFVCTASCIPGSSGSAAGQFSVPAGVAASDDSLFVADQGNRRVAVTRPDGTFLRAFGLGVGAGGSCTSSCTIGAGGAGAGALAAPDGVAVAAGEVYVADPGNDRVAVFSTAGTFLRAFGKDVDPSGDATPDVCAAQCQKGSTGAGDGRLNAPVGIAVADDQVFVAEQDASRVSVFSPDGTFLRSFATSGGEAGQLDEPAAIAVSGGEVFVADRLNQRISVFSEQGTFARAFGDEVDGADDDNADICTTSCSAGIAGAGAGQLSDPSGLAVALGVVFVSDTANARVSEFELDGTFVRAFGKGVAAGGATVCANTCTAGADDGGAGSLSSPAGLAITGAELAVADTGNHRLSLFDVPRPLVTVASEALNLHTLTLGAGPGPKSAATLSNTGNTPITISGTALSGADPDQFALPGANAGDCAAGTILAPGQSCAVQAQFAPTSTGLKRATVTVASTAPDARVFLSGTATDAPATKTAASAPTTSAAPTTVTSVASQNLPSLPTVPSFGQIVRVGAPRIVLRHRHGHVVGGQVITGYVAVCPAGAGGCVAAGVLRAVLRHRGLVAVSESLGPVIRLAVANRAIRALAFNLSPRTLRRLPRHAPFNASITAAVRAGTDDPTPQTEVLRLKWPKRG